MNHATEIVRFAKRLGPDGLAVGTAGNISVRAGAEVWITPSGVPYEDLEPEDVCVVPGAGRPSTELPMHLAVYERTDAGAVVHTHSPFATALACVLDELPAIHYLVVQLGGPVPVVDYATPGGAELADAVGAALEARSAVLLQNHGTITIGDTLHAAYERARLLEWLCALYHRARTLGEPRLLSDDELDVVAQELRDYGMG